jgi:hypothetical protein
VTINWTIWKPKKRYGLYQTQIATIGMCVPSAVDVDIKVEILVEHTMGYEVKAVDIVSGGEIFSDVIKEKILKSVPDFLEAGKVLVSE